MRAFPSVVLAGLLSLTAPLVVSSASADPASPVVPVPSGPTSSTPSAGTPSAGTLPGDSLPIDPQTSDGVLGEMARPLTAAQRRKGDSTNIRKLVIAPGVNYYQWDEASQRGANRMYLLQVAWQTPGLSIDYANPGNVASTTPVATMLKADEKAGAVAGVNGDFFDISGSGAPRGVGRDLERGLLNGQLSGWNGAFSFKKSGWPTIGLLATENRVRYYPQLEVTSLNGPVVEPDEIGAYTPAWGKASGTDWTGGQKSTVRYVQVYNHRVVRAGYTLPVGKTFQGTLLVGRGKGAIALRDLKVGATTDVLSAADGNPRMAIGGNRFLIRHGILQPKDDTEMHPRTAIGIDRDTKSVLIFVVDGRQADSRGYTMVELADKMADFGADDALNLDGGGSTQMIAKRNKDYRVMNQPSDGYARPVANALEIRYQAPKTAR